MFYVPSLVIDTDRYHCVTRQHTALAVKHTELLIIVCDSLSCAYYSSRFPYHLCCVWMCDVYHWTVLVSDIGHFTTSVSEFLTHLCDVGYICIACLVIVLKQLVLLYKTKHECCCHVRDVYEMLCFTMLCRGDSKTFTIGISWINVGWWYTWNACLVLW